jgi:hypothetical protein
MTKRIITLLPLFFLILKLSTAQVDTFNYMLNTTIMVKQGPGMPALKNPFTGGLQLPQFSAIDLNLDGIKDLMIFDRGTKKYYTFINDGKKDTASYTYAPEFEMTFPECNSFCLTYDYNNDGKMDLIKESNGFLLQYRNNSNLTTHALSFEAPDTLFDCTDVNIFCPSTNIPSFNDIDNDGDMDILTWDPTGFTINYYKNFREEKGMNKEEWKYGFVEECWGKFYLSFYLQLGIKCGFVYPSGNEDHPCGLAPGSSQLNQSAARNLRMPGSGRITPVHSGSTLLTFDVDSDGDYEALLGDIYYNYLYFIKNGKKEFNWPRDTMIAKDSMYPSPAERMQVDYFPAAYHIDLDNDGRRDIVLAPNDQSGASKDKNQIYFYKNIGTDKKPVFKLIQKDFLMETSVDFGGGAAPAFMDIDNDGDKDLFVANQGEYTQTLNSKDRIAYYRNTGSDMSPVYELQDTDFLSLSAKSYSSIRISFGDLNGDGKKDMVLGESNGLLKYYVNTSGATPSFTENTMQLSTFQDRNYCAPYLVDFDRDGKLDLFTGNYDGTITYYKNTGTTSSPTFTKTTDSVGKICTRQLYVDPFTGERSFYLDGMSIPVISDLNNDGKFDLIVGGKYGLYLFRNFESHLSDSLTADEKFLRYKSFVPSPDNPVGMYAMPATAMMDSDAYTDLIVGSSGGGFGIFTTNGPGKVGIRKSAQARDIKISPNPAFTSITVSGIDDEKYSIQVFDITGKLVIFTNARLKNHEINISALEQGAYIICVSSVSGESYTAKFVKM